MPAKKVAAVRQVNIEGSQRISLVPGVANPGHGNLRKGTAPLACHYWRLPVDCALTAQFFHGLPQYPIQNISFGADI
jgi:hypothetical protein